MSAPLAEHENKIMTYPGLFDRINEVHTAVCGGDKNINGYSSEQIRLTERVHLDFVRAGAKLDTAAQARYKTIMMELAELTTTFAQNVLADEGSFALDLFAEKDDLVGLPQDLIDAMKQAAVEKGHSDGRCHATLSRSIVEPFLTNSDHRSHRETLWRAWVSRGTNPERDNTAIIRKILTLRLEQAQLHGYTNYAEYATADTMAQKPSKVMDLLERVWTPARASCLNEQEALNEFVSKRGESKYIFALLWCTVYDLDV